MVLLVVEALVLVEVVLVVVDVLGALGEYVKLVVVRITWLVAGSPQEALTVYVPLTQFDDPPRTNLCW